MKMLMNKMFLICGGAMIVGYLYVKKHPDKIEKLKKIGDKATSDALDIIDSN